MLIASLGVLFLLLVNQNVFCDEEPPEDPLPPSNMTLRFSPFHLTNSFVGVIETTPNIQGNWINISTNDSCINVCANSTNITQNARGLVNCSFQLGSTNENCHVSYNLTLTCLWDETADEKGQDDYLVTFCKKLSFDDKVSGTILPTLNNTVHDSDVYYFESNGKSGFCFEVDSSSELDYKISFDDCDWGNINKVQLLDKHGNEISKKYRLYVTNDLTGVQYSFFMVKRKSGSSSNEISYNINLKKVRPLLLVHGISSKPTEEHDNYITLIKRNRIAFYNIYKDVSSWDEFKPAIPFPFPWDSEIGSYESFCDGASSLNAFNNKKTQNWFLGPVIMAHSMGGLLSVKQIQINASFALSLNGLVCLGTPFCGSVFGNSTVGLARYFKSFNDTSPENLIHLSRGTSYVLSRISNFPDVIRTLNYKKFIYSKIERDLYSPLCYISGEGDGIVSYCSSNIGGTLNWSDCEGEESGLRHTIMDELVLKDYNGRHKVIYNALKNLLNQ